MPYVLIFRFLRMFRNMIEEHIAAKIKTLRDHNFVYATNC